jgi:GT2 family glycosyltransferase
MRRLLHTLRQRIRLLNRQRLRKRQAARGPAYPEWVQAYDSLGEAERRALQARLNMLTNPPVIAVLMPVCNPPPEWLQQAIASVRSQLYPHWQLCIADDASTDPAVNTVLTQAAASDSRVRLVRRPQSGHISRALNSALEVSDAPYAAVLGPDGLLREHALLLVAEALQHWPCAQVVYSDEDKLAIDGTLHSPYFKPDWDPELLLSQSYLCHLVTYCTERVRDAGGFRVGYEGAQDHDLALRVTQCLAADQIVHIPHVLYHVRQQDRTVSGAAEPDALLAGRRAVQDHVQRLGLHAVVSQDDRGWYALRATAPQHLPEVTLIVPTRDGRLTLPRCFSSLTRLTSYPNWRLLVVDNGSVDAGFLRTLTQVAEHPRCRVVRDDRPFNYSALNNHAVSTVDSEYVLLLNDDTEVVSPDWLDQLLGWAAQPGVGAVGARLWYADMTLQHAGVVLGIGDVAGHAHRHLLREEAGYHGRAALLQDFSALTGACLLVRRDHYLAVGGLDEAQLGVAYNDVDFCLKLREKGLRNIYVPMAQLMHHESVSRGSDREAAKRQRMLREAAVMVERWGALLARDPAYNPNLSLADEGFGLAFPPRVNLCTRWFEALAARPCRQE